MKKRIQKLGKVLTSVEQKRILGGFGDDPIDGPGGGSGGNGPWLGVCFDNGPMYYVPCTSPV